MIDIKPYRENIGLTQEKLANEVGASRQMIGLIENGTAKPSVKLSKKIAAVLGFDWTRFYEDEETQHKAG